MAPALFSSRELHAGLAPKVSSHACMRRHLATAVLAFVPQVELEKYPMATRRDFTAEHRRRFTARLLASVAASQAAIAVHVGASKATPLAPALRPREMMTHKNLVNLDASGRW